MVRGEEIARVRNLTLLVFTGSVLLKRNFPKEGMRLEMVTGLEVIVKIEG